MLRKFVFVFVFSTLFLFVSNKTVFAQYQTNSSWTTKVGDPKTPPPGGNATGGGDIVSWAGQITGALQPGLWEYYNRMLADVSNGSYNATKRSGANRDTVYWCTYLVIDAYNLASKTGLSIGSHGAVVNMIRFFKEKSSNSDNSLGYKYLDYLRQDPKYVLSNTKPGYAFLLADDEYQTHEREHTGIVKSITINSEVDGTGWIETLESNSDKTSHKFFFKNWVVSGFFYKLDGFGGL